MGRTRDRLSYRSTGIPRAASPHARSRYGLIWLYGATSPMVRSRSPAPDPCTMMSAGNGPFPPGRVSVPGSGTGPGTVTSRSVIPAGNCGAASDPAPHAANSKAPTAPVTG